MDANNNINIDKTSNGVDCEQSNCVPKEKINPSLSESTESTDSSTAVTAKPSNASQPLDPPTPDYVIRRMQLQDIKAVLDLWERYELYEGKHTIQTFMQIDPEGFYVAVDKNNGKFIASLLLPPFFDIKVILI